VLMSNYGCSAVDLMAPGEWILGPISGGLAVDSGTSYSAALTSGVAALVWAEHPDWDWSQVKSALMNSSLPSADMQGLSISEGILRADKALSVQSTAPSVWQVTPALIRPGSEVAIQGRTFGSAEGEVIALVDGQEVKLAVSEWADQQIKVQVPAQFPYGLASIKVKASNSQWSGQSCMHISDSVEQAGTLVTPRSEAVTVQLGGLLVAGLLLVLRLR
jgi:Subtilase family/IPT/TIG domain